MAELQDAEATKPFAAWVNLTLTIKRAWVPQGHPLVSRKPRLHTRCRQVAHSRFADHVTVRQQDRRTLKVTVLTCSSRSCSRRLWVLQPALTDTATPD
jgi:hypothetical protein